MPGRSDLGLRLALALAACLALAGAARAVTLTVPIGPGNEGPALELVAPYELGGPVLDTGLNLAGVSIEGKRIRYGVGPGATVERWVTLDLAGEPRVVRDPAEGPAERALDAVAVALEARVATGQLVIERVAEAPRKAPGVIEPSPATPEGEADKAPPPAIQLSPQMEVERYLSLALALLLLLAGALAWRPLGRALALADRRTWLAAGVVTALVGALLAWLPDTVLFHRGHGFSLMERVDESVALGAFEDIHTGYIARDLSVWLSGPASAAVTHAASRVAGALALLALFAWVLALTRRPRAALMALGLLACQPGYLFAGCSGFPLPEGLLLLGLAGWLATLAGRHRTWPLVLAAGAALGMLGGFRLMGLFVVLPMAAMALVVAPAEGAPRGRAWALRAGVAGLILAVPVATRAWYVLGVGAEHGSPMAWPGFLFEALAAPNIFTEGYWLPAAVVTLALLGAFVVAAGGSSALQGRRRWLFLAALLGAAWAIVVIGVVSGENWLDMLRYQGWVMPLLAVLAALALDFFIALRAPRGWMVVGAALIALGVSVWRPAHSLSMDHPEQLTLAAWRRLPAQLPEGATLLLPRRADGIGTTMPATWLKAQRPDLRLAYIEDASAPLEPGSFVFDPLTCHVAFPPIEGIDAPLGGCAAIHELALVPVDLRGLDISGEPWPGAHSRRGWPTSLDEPWVSPPVLDAHRRIGLYRVLSR